jgi:hypothetical protein
VGREIDLGWSRRLRVVGLMVASVAATVSAYLRYACGHAALVTLPRVKGESARQREQRIALEKTSALARQCDFCTPALAPAQEESPAPVDGVTVDQPEESVVMTTSDTIERAPSARSKPDAASAASAEAKNGRSPLRRLSDEQELELTRLYSETDTPVPQIASRFGVGESSVYRISQRHGASLRGRRSTGAAAASGATAAAKKTRAPRKAAATGTAPRAARGARAVPAAKTETAAAAPAARAPRAARATRAPRATAAAAAAATPARAGRRGRRPAAAAATTTTTRTTGRATSARRGATAGRRSPAAARASASGARGRFRVQFVGVAVVQATSIREAMARAEALGAQEITSITRA